MSPPVFLLEGSADGFWGADVRPGATVAVTGSQGRHGANVRRLRRGESVQLVDGAGGRATGVVAGVGKDAFEVRILDVAQEPPSAPRLVVVQALLKGASAEAAVRAMTEVGVDEIIPWQAERCVVRWDGGRAERGRARWSSTCLEASKQARRARVPLVAPVARSDTVRERVGDADVALLLHEEAPTETLAGLTELLAGAAAEVVLVVGPEGGITGEELAGFRGAGGHLLRLGPTVLRGADAGVVGAAVVLSRTRRWLGPS